MMTVVLITLLIIIIVIRERWRREVVVLLCVIIVVCTGFGGSLFLVVGVLFFRLSYPFPRVKRPAAYVRVRCYKPARFSNFVKDFLAGAHH